ncbi:MAG TPA: hypothetical protein VEJ18_08520, partial [Planctomycetota bacterium]|nr:hypothetical protein [Planctomycetota bacterium]
AKPLAALLLEAGAVAPDDLRALGVDPPPPSKAPPDFVRAPLTKPRRTSVGAWAALLLAGVAAVVWMLARPEPAPAPVDPDAAPKAELEAIAASASPDLANAPDVVRRYEASVRRHQGTRWELEAHRRLQEFRGRLEAEARKALAPLEAATTDLDRLKACRAFPEAFAGTEAGASVRARRSDVEARLRKVRAEAEQLLADGLYAAAGARAREAGADDLVLRIEAESRTELARARRDVADKYLELDGPVKDLLRRRPPNPRAAARKVLEFLRAPWDELRRPLVRPAGVDLDALSAAVDAWDAEKILALLAPVIPDPASPDRLSTAATAVLDLRAIALLELFFRDVRAAVDSGERVELPSLGPGRFVKRDGKTVFAREGADVVAASEAPLSDEDLAALAARGREGVDLHLRAGFFWFLCGGERPEKAYEHLARAREAGARGVDVYLAGLLSASRLELARSLRTKVEAAKESFAKGQRATTRGLLGEVLAHADHPYVSEQRAEIERMLFEIAEGSEKERRLAAQTKGRAETLGDGRMRVAYDFESAEQVDGFDFVTEEDGRTFRGRWRHDKGGLESSTLASVMRWKTPLKGDVELEMDLMPLQEPQNVVVDLYYNRGAARHYAVVFAFDWVGRSEGDNDNSVEDRMGMPRMGVLKYPVAADKSAWRNPDAWAPWKAALVGKGAGAALTLGRAVRLRIERRGASLRVLAGGEPIWEGEDPAYTDGHVLFFSDSRVRLDNLSVTFRPE